MRPALNAPDRHTRGFRSQGEKARLLNALQLFAFVPGQANEPDPEVGQRLRDLRRLSTAPAIHCNAGKREALAQRLSRELRPPK